MLCNMYLTFFTRIVLFAVTSRYLTSIIYFQINETLLRGVTRKLFFNPGLGLAPHLAAAPAAAPHTQAARLEVTGAARLHLDEVWSGLGSAGDRVMV